MILMSSQNGAMIGGEDEKLKSPTVLVCGVPNDSTPFVFTCNSQDGVMHNINIIAAEIKYTFHIVSCSLT